MDFYSRRIPISPTLGLEEGESRKTCPPGMVKSYLPNFPWSECIPEDQALRPDAYPSVIPSGGPTVLNVPRSDVPAPLPPPAPVAPPPPPLPEVPRKARFLTVDEKTGAYLDPDTGAVVEAASVYTLDTTDTVAIGAGLGFVAVLLALAGVFE